MSDEQKLFRALNSNKKDKIEAVFNEIYYQYYALLVYVASQYLDNYSDIEDIVQETFLAFFNNINQVNSSIKGYLTTACKNNALIQLKRNNKVTLISDFDEDKFYSRIIEFIESDNAVLKKSLVSDLISDMKEKLTEKEVKIIILHLINDMSFEEVALKLNISVNTIKTRYYRALRKYQSRRKKYEKE